MPGMHSATRCTTLLLASVLALGCGSTANPDGEDGPGLEPESGPDVFACGVAHACTQDTGHLGEITDEDLRCGGELVADGQPGAVLVLSQPGPYPTEVEMLVVLLGDGTALQQIRSRCASDGACAEQNTTEWSVKPMQLCDIGADPGDIAGCDEPEGACAWLAYGTNCEYVPETWTCDALP
jgi:hypothetical protein